MAPYVVHKWLDSEKSGTEMSFKDLKLWKNFSLIRIKSEKRS